MSTTTLDASLGTTDNTAGSTYGLNPLAATFWEDVLADIPDVAPSAITEDIGELAGWSQNEGTSAENNPLATTVKEPGSTQFNSTGVQNFPNPTVGEEATAQTLQQSQYRNIVADLQTGTPFGSNTQSEFSTWSGGGYSTPDVNPTYNSPAIVGDGVGLASSGTVVTDQSAASYGFPGQNIPLIGGILGDVEDVGLRLGIMTLGVLLVIIGIFVATRTNPLKTAETAVMAAV